MLKPIVVNTNELETVESALKNQKTGNADTRLLNKDQKIWKQKVDKTALIYIPRDEDGNFIFESAPQLSLVGLGQFGRDIRLTDGIAGLEAYGISGRTDAQNAIQECYDLQKLLVSQAMVAEGKDPSVPMTPEEYRSLLQAHKVPERAVQMGRSNAVVFPIVEIQINEETKMPVIQDNKPIVDVYWMQMPQKRFEEKFAKEVVEYQTDSIAGNFLRFSYLLPADLKTSTDESKRNMAAGRNFQVALRSVEPLFKEYAPQMPAYLDKIAKEAGYTREAIRTSLDAFALYTDEDVNKLIATSMVETRARLAALNEAPAGQTTIAAPTQAQDAPSVTTIDLAL